MFAYKIGLIHPAAAGLISSDGEVSYKPDRCKGKIKEILIDEIIAEVSGLGSGKVANE